ncbi:MAG: hypothetical protein ACKVS8_10055 [Phycisphaerales bacterium]
MSYEAADFDWMKCQTARLDELIAGGLADAWQEPGVATDDHAAAAADLANLKHGKDCHYDSPSIGVLYAAVYHGKRLQQAVSALYKPLSLAVAAGNAIDILDVGSGTGSTIWAVSLILLGLHARDCRPASRVRLVECDASPFMLRQAELLWQRLCGHFPTLRDFVDRLPPVYGSWDRIEMPNPRTPWIVASHLLHATDAATPAMRAAGGAIAATLGRLAQRHDASRIIAWQVTRVKEGAMDGALNGLRVQGWCDVSDNTCGAHLTEENAGMPRVRGFVARQLPAGSQPKNSGYWRDFPPNVLMVRQTAPTGLLFDYEPLPHHVFDEQQEEVLSGKPKHALIQGAAGSGKTLLLSARILQCVADAEPGRRRDVLVTAFNKSVIAAIREYVEKGVYGLPPVLVQTEDGGWKYESALVHIRARVFDNLPWGLQAGLKPVLNVRGRDPCPFAPVAEELSRAWNECISAEFVEDEFALIVYGRCELSPERDRHGVVRRGRGHLRELSAMQWNDLISILDRTFGKPGPVASPPPTFCHARLQFLAALRAPSHPFAGRFSEMFVDEAQDFTRTDWRILEAMATGNAAWTICWDRTQAVRTGKTFDSPTAVVPKLGSVGRTILRRGYRVPRTVARLANLLTQQISGGRRDIDESERALLVEPQLHAVPGARPLILFGNDTAALCMAISDAIATIVDVCPDIRHGKWMLAEYTTAARGPQAAAVEEAAKGAGLPVLRATTILADKGPEYDPVIWLADLPMPSDERWRESLFTILTRTRGFLLIAHTAAIDPRAKEFLRSVWQAHPALVRWSMPAKAYWQKA